MKINENSARPAIANRKSKIGNPPYSIRKHIAFWSLTFNGEEACFDHEQGAYYVGYLLLHPPSEPIAPPRSEHPPQVGLHSRPGGNRTRPPAQPAFIRRHIRVDERRLGSGAEGGDLAQGVLAEDPADPVLGPAAGQHAVG